MIIEERYSKILEIVKEKTWASLQNYINTYISNGEKE